MLIWTVQFTNRNFEMTDSAKGGECRANGYMFCMVGDTLRVRN